MSDLERILDEQAEGDQEFKLGFSARCHDNYEEFYNGFQEVLELENYDSLKRISHKVKALNGLFEFYELQDALDELERYGSSFTNQKATIDKVISESKNALEEFEKIKTT